MGYNFANLSNQPVELKLIRTTPNGTLPVPMVEGETGLEHLDQHEVAGGIKINPFAQEISCFGSQNFVENILIRGRVIMNVNGHEYDVYNLPYKLKDILNDGEVRITNPQGTNYYRFEAIGGGNVRVKLTPKDSTSSVSIVNATGSEVAKLGSNTFGDIYGFCLAPDITNFCVGTDTFSGDIFVNVTATENISDLSAKFNKSEIITFQNLEELKFTLEEFGIKVDIVPVTGVFGAKSILRIANTSGKPGLLGIHLPTSLIAKTEHLGLGTRTRVHGPNSANVELTAIELALSGGNAPPPQELRWNRVRNMIVKGGKFKITTDEQLNATLTPDVMGPDVVDWVGELGAVPLQDTYHKIGRAGYTIEEYNAVATKFFDPCYHIATSMVSLDIDGIPTISISPQPWDLHSKPYGNGPDSAPDRTDDFWFVNRGGRMIPVYWKTDLPLAYKTLLGSNANGTHDESEIHADFGADVRSPVINEFSLECGLKGLPGSATPYFANMVIHEGVIWFRALIPSATKSDEMELTLKTKVENGYVGFGDRGQLEVKIGIFKFINGGE